MIVDVQESSSISSGASCHLMITWPSRKFLLLNLLSVSQPSILRSHLLLRRSGNSSPQAPLPAIHKIFVNSLQNIRLSFISFSFDSSQHGRHKWGRVANCQSRSTSGTGANTQWRDSNCQSEISERMYEIFWTYLTVKVEKEAKKAAKVAKFEAKLDKKVRDS